MNKDLRKALERELSDLMAEQEAITARIEALKNYMSACDGASPVPKPRKKPSKQEATPPKRKKKATHSDGTPNRHGSAAGLKYKPPGHPCCGSKGFRHKGGCHGVPKREDKTEEEIEETDDTSLENQPTFDDVVNGASDEGGDDDKEDLYECIACGNPQMRPRDTDPNTIECPNSNGHPDHKFQRV